MSAADPAPRRSQRPRKPTGKVQESEDMVEELSQLLGDEISSQSSSDERYVA